MENSQPPMTNPLPGITRAPPSTEVYSSSFRHVTYFEVTPSMYFELCANLFIHQNLIHSPVSIFQHARSLGVFSRCVLTLSYGTIYNFTVCAIYFVNLMFCWVCYRTACSVIKLFLFCTRSCTRSWRLRI